MFPILIIEALGVKVVADEFLFKRLLWLIFGKNLSLYLRALRDDFGNYWKTLIDFIYSFKF